MRRGIDTQARLLAELNHRVRNALQIAIGLVSHEGRQADIPETRFALFRAAERLQVLASAHRPLYATADPGLVDLTALFGDVIGQAQGMAPTPPSSPTARSPCRSSARWRPRCCSTR
ncbi:histidine kinase dimerization/phosphoacceptor domain -containing protein [Sphingomonas sp. I4]